MEYCRSCYEKMKNKLGMLSMEILSRKRNEPPQSVPKVAHYHNEILGPASQQTVGQKNTYWRR